MLWNCPVNSWKIFAGRRILLGGDHDPGRGSWCWQRMMIFADDHDRGRQACSCWNSMILVENKEPAFPDHLGTTLGPFSAEFENWFASVSGPVWGQSLTVGSLHNQWKKDKKDTVMWFPYDFHMMIFNRWGEIVFESFSEENSWYPSSTGSNTGVYTWKMNVKYRNSEKAEWIGHVTVLR